MFVTIIQYNCLERAADYRIHSCVKLYPTMKNNPKYLKIATFFDDFTLVLPILPLYFLNNGVSLSAFVISQAFYSAAVILSEVPTGIIADRVGHKKSLIFGQIVAVLGGISFIAFPNIFGLYLGYFLAGIGTAFASGSTEALLFESLKKDKRSEFQKEFSHVRSYSAMAFSLGTALVGVSLGLWDEEVIKYLLYASVATGTLSIFVLTKLVDPKQYTSNVPSDSKMWQTFTTSLKSIRKDSTLLNLTYSKLLTLSAQFVVFGVYQAYFKDGSVPILWIGISLTIGGLVNSVLMRNVHKLEKYLTLDKAILWFNLTLAVTYLAFSFATSPILLVVLFIAMQAQYNLQDPIVSDYINDRIDSTVRAATLSTISLVRQIGNITSKLLLGFAVAGVGITGMLKLQALYLVIGSLLTYWLLVRCGCVYKLEKSE